MAKDVRGLPKDVRSLARCYTEKAVQTLGSIMLSSEQDSVRVAAAQALLDRGWGRPKPDEQEGEQITVVIRRIIGEGPGSVEILEPVRGELLPPERP